MKILITVLLLILAIINTSAQTANVNGKPIKDIGVEYIEIVGTARAFSNKINVEIDFGQQNKLFSSQKDTRVVDKEGKRVKFNSMIDAMNFFSDNGYEFIDSYIVGGKNAVYHWLLQKRKE